MFTRFRNTASVVLMFFCIVNETFAQVSDAIDSSATYEEPQVIKAELSMLTPPDGFVKSDQFDGYYNPNMGAAIMMSIIDKVPYSILKASMTEEFFTENKLTKISESPLVVSDKMRGVVYKCSFNTQGHDFIRFIIYAGDLTKTLWINVTYSALLDEQLEPEIMNSLKTINIK
jgi:hypothetical protein